MATIEEQLEVLMSGAEYGDPETRENMRRALRERLQDVEQEGRPLRVYCGYDPRKPDLHLGHTITMRKLRQFQDFGHEVIFLVGTFTSLIGDPSDKGEARDQLTMAEVEENARTYAEQAFKILDPAKTTIRYNHEWLSALNFADVIRLASNFTVQQFLSRENFSKRYTAGEAIFLHEFFYALMQAYDAVALGVDIQVGGTEQLFNLMAGRKLQETFGQEPLIPITLPILVGTDGQQRMSKTTGNYVAIVDPPEDQYGKTMSLPDEAMANWFQLLTTLRQPEIDQLMAAIAAGEVHPMAAKKRLAHEIVTIFHDADAADGAAAHFERTVQSGELPAEIPERAVTAAIGLLDLLAEAGLVASRSEGRRLVQQGGVRLDGHAVTDVALVVEPGEPRVLQVGKRRFLKLV